MSIESLNALEGTTRRARVPVMVVFYGGLCLLMGAIFSGVLDSVMPASMASHVSDDSEAYVFALVLAAWIQGGVWRQPRERLLPWAWAVGALCAVITVVLLSTDLPGSVKTLNETFFALAVLIPYVSLRRPLRWRPQAWSLVLIFVIGGGVALWPDSLWLTLAEGLTMVVIAPWAFDVLDRVILGPCVKNESWRRPVLYGALIGVPVVVVLLGVERRAGGGLVPQTLDYIGRSQEAFVGMLLVLVFLALMMPFRRPGQA